MKQGGGTRVVTFYMPRYTVSRSGVDCKSVVTDSGGATPSLGTILWEVIPHQGSGLV